MKDILHILPGAELIEVVLGVNQGDILSEQSKYFCSLAFKQVNDDKTEIVKDVYSISREQCK